MMFKHECSGRRLLSLSLNELCELLKMRTDALISQIQVGKYQCAANQQDPSEKIVEVLNAMVVRGCHEMETEIPHFEEKIVDIDSVRLTQKD